MYRVRGGASETRVGIAGVAISHSISGVRPRSYLFTSGSQYVGHLAARVTTQITNFWTYFPYIVLQSLLLNI